MKKFVALIAMSLFSASAFAQDVDENGNIITYKKKTEIDFEGVEVEGELVKPQGALLLERKKASFNPLIRLRENFNLEMNQSVNQIK